MQSTELRSTNTSNLFVPIDQIQILLKEHIALSNRVLFYGIHYLQT